jgi:hypothetical protein
MDVVERVLEKMKEKEKEKDDAVIKGTGLYGITGEHSSAVLLKAYDNLMKEKRTWIINNVFTMFNNILGLKIGKRVFYWDKKIDNWVLSGSNPQSYPVDCKLVRVDKGNLKKGKFYQIGNSGNSIKSYGIWDGKQFVVFSEPRNHTFNLYKKFYDEIYKIIEI